MITSAKRGLPKSVARNCASVATHLCESRSCSARSRMNCKISETSASVASRIANIAAIIPAMRKLMFLALAAVALGAARKLEPTVTPEMLRHSRLLDVLYFVNVVYGLAVLFLLLRSGASAKLRDLAERTPAAAPVYVMFLVVAMTLLEFPLAFYEGFVVPHQFDLTNESLAMWLGDEVKALGVGLIISALVGGLLLLAIRKIKRWWIGPLARPLPPPAHPHRLPHPAARDRSDLQQVRAAEGSGARPRSPRRGRARGDSAQPRLSGRQIETDEGDERLRHRHRPLGAHRHVGHAAPEARPRRSPRRHGPRDGALRAESPLERHRLLRRALVLRLLDRTDPLRARPGAVGEPLGHPRGARRPRRPPVAPHPQHRHHVPDLAPHVGLLAPHRVAGRPLRPRAHALQRADGQRLREIRRGLEDGSASAKVHRVVALLAPVAGAADRPRARVPAVGAEALSTPGSTFATARGMQKRLPGLVLFFAAAPAFAADPAPPPKPRNTSLGGAAARSE